MPRARSQTAASQAIVRATPNLADALTAAGTVPLDNELLRLVHDNLAAQELGQLADRIDDVVQVRPARGRVLHLRM